MCARSNWIIHSFLQTSLHGLKNVIVPAESIACPQRNRYRFAFHTAQVTEVYRKTAKLKNTYSGLERNVRMFSSNGRILKRLVVLDFDHTVCEHNTDIVVRDLLGPEGIPPDVRSILRSSGWIPYMQRVFRLLHQRGFGPMEIASAIRGIPEVPGMKACITNLVRRGFHVIIISDSNSEFIRLWNDFNDIGRYIHTVFTNPAHFDSNGLLELRPYHYQTECALSSKNLCKGKILEQFLRRQHDERNVVYEKVFYAGDGKNDVCPMLRLSSNGFACARRGYSCYNALQSAIGKLEHKYTAKVLQWTDGHELNDFIWTELED